MKRPRRQRLRKAVTTASPDDERRRRLRSGACRAHNPKVVGSNPTPATTFRGWNAPRTENGTGGVLHLANR